MKSITKNIIEQIRILSQLLDTLLPKLINV